MRLDLMRAKHSGSSNQSGRNNPAGVTHPDFAVRRCVSTLSAFKRIWAAKHGIAADDYKKRFGLPWTRGLTSAASLANSGWTDERKAKARKLARKSQFFKLAHLTPRREFAPFLKAEAVEHLGANATPYGEENLTHECVSWLRRGSALGRSPEYSRLTTPPCSNASSGGANRNLTDESVL